MPAASRTLARSHLLVFGVFFAALVALHLPYLSLPYFWDELGQFIPASLDILRSNAWVPHSTVPNVHPPGVMAFLALAWRLCGYSVVVTRVAMLVVAATGVYATFLLCIRMCRDVPGAPAFIAAGLLIVTPLFYTQAMMAQLDMPAMTLTAVALLLFFDRRYAWCVLACTALALTKETGVIAPALFGAWLLFRERNWKQAVWFAAPLLALSAWLFVLWRATGHLLGDPGFAHYNVTYQLHPVRLSATLLRRLYFLFVADFRWIGSIVILSALRFTRSYQRWEWTVAAFFAGGHVLLISAFGGAALERYLLPVFPLLYIAMATGWAGMSRRWRNATEAALAIGLFAGLYWNPPFPFPLENNLAMVDFVELQKAAAGYLDRYAPDSIVASAWPYTGALRNPDLGFTQHAYRVVETSDFHTANVVDACRTGEPGVLILYSRTWEPHWGVLGNRAARQFLHKYYDYEPQISSQQVEELLGMHPVLRWEQRGQWIEIFTR
jgi:4-amino-4-deoxy-L-arabinose transferase-like glycosyltransferase